MFSNIAAAQIHYHGYKNLPLNRNIYELHPAHTFEQYFSKMYFNIILSFMLSKQVVRWKHYTTENYTSDEPHNCWFSHRWHCSILSVVTSDMEFHENPSSGSRNVPCGQKKKSQKQLFAIFQKGLKHTNTIYGLNVKLKNVKTGGTYTNHWVSHDSSWNTILFLRIGASAIRSTVAALLL